MKTNLMLLGAAIAMSHSAFAQSTSASLPASAADAAPAANASIAEGSAVGASTGIKPKITYLGIVHGPGLNSDSFNQDAYETGPVQLEHRLRLLAAPSDNLNFGLETRFLNTLHGKDAGGVDLQNLDYRAVVYVKHIYKDSIVDLSLTPRLKLPTSSSSREAQMIVAPEFIASADVTIPDSRLSFSPGILLQKSFYKDTAPTKGLTFVTQPWVEADYQMSPSIQAMLAYWPELDTKGMQGSAAQNTSNEIDVGANIDVAKGWTLTPYLEVQPNGMDTANAAEAAKNVQFNVYISGAFL